MKNDTLIIFSPGFAESENDSTCIPGIQQFVMQLRELRPELDLRVFSLHYPFNEGAYVWNGVNCYSFGGRNRGRPYAWYLRRKAKKHLEECIRSNKVKAILSFWMLDCALIANQVSKRTGVPHFCWMWGQDARAMNKLVKQIKPDPQKVIAISDMLQREFENNHGIRAQHLVDNGITESLFPEFDGSPREYDVIGVGSLNANKNYSLFVDVIVQLKKEFPHIKSMILGDGEERELIQKKINSLDLANNIILKGSIPHTEALRHMCKSKVFLHTSHYEGSSGVIMEGLYSGCHVVSTVSVSLQPVSNLQLASDVSGLTQKIARLLREKELKHERVLFNSMKSSAQKIMSILDL